MKNQQSNRGYGYDAQPRHGSKDIIQLQSMGHTVSHEQIQVQYSTQHYGQAQFPQPQSQMQGFGPQYAQQYGQMQGYGHPSPQMIPASQYMARDSTTPMPADFERPQMQPQKPPIWLTIIKRIISALFILLDSFLSWWHFATLSGESELIEKFDFINNLFSLGKSGKGGNFEALQCEGTESTWTALKATFTALSTVWACFQLINMTGETVIEYNLSGEKDNAEDIENSARTLAKSQSSTCFRGFQIVHGWVETVVSLVCGDIPQVIIAIVIGVHCTIDSTSLAQTVVWMIIKSMKNDIRKTTCKHKYKPCCDDCCKDCCVYYFDFPCVCSVFIFRLCGICGNEKVFECLPFALCPGGFCTRGGHCCGNMDEDPDWARRIATKLKGLYFYACVAVILLIIF